MEIGFKTFEENDIPDILKMMAAFNAIDDYLFDIKRRHECLIKFIANKELGRLYLLRNKVESIGYIVLTFGFSFEYEGRDAFIDEFFIKEEFRNKGAGKATIDFIEKESVKLGINAIHLEVEIHNSIASRLYVNKGFSTNGRKLLTKRLKVRGHLK